MRHLPWTAVGFVAAVVAAGIAGGPRTLAQDELVIAVQPTATAEQLADQAAELERFLEARLGRKVTLRFPTSHAGVIEALRFGHAHAAFMGAWPAALAAEQAEAEVVLAEVREVLIDGQRAEAPYYFSHWVVRRDSPYQSLDALRGKAVAFPNPLSTSGYVAPLAKLVDLGLVPVADGPADPKQFFGDVHFAGGYAQAWAALKSGQVEAAIIAGDVPEALYREVLGATRVLETQGPIPSHAVVMRKDLDPALRQSLTEALVALGDPAHRPLMRKFVSGIFLRFEPATTEEHLGSLARFLTSTRLQFAEKRL